MEDAVNHSGHELQSFKDAVVARLEKSRIPLHAYQSAKLLLQ